MSTADKKEVYHMFAASAVLIFILFFGYFSGDGDFPNGLKSSVEIGVSSLSPRGLEGGFIIPASCPSYEHTPGECTASPSADIKASTNSTVWANGFNGPLNPPDGTAITITWHTSGGLSYSCVVTKNSGPCQISDSCTASNAVPNLDSANPPAAATINNAGNLTGSFNYTIVCTDSIGRTGADSVLISTGGTGKFICSQGACISDPGAGPNTGGCNSGNQNSRCALTQCNDGIDNDSDGKADFGGVTVGGVRIFSPDLGCTSVYDNNESNIPTIFKECDPGLQRCE